MSLIVSQQVVTISK